MPINIIDDNNNINLEPLPAQNIINEKGLVLGRFRCNIGQNGLALLKFDQIHSDTVLQMSLAGHRIKTWRPFWWSKSSNSNTCVQTDQSNA